MAKAALLVLTLILVGCTPDERVTLEGRVGVARDSNVPLADAAVRGYRRYGSLFGRARTDADGRFSLAGGPVGRNVFLEVEADDGVITSFSGVTGPETVLPIEDGTLYGVPRSELDALEAQYAGCEGVGEGGAVVGEMRIYNLTDPDTGEQPLVTTGVVTVTADDGSEWHGCYLDEDGVAYAPDADVTGNTGQFAIFGIAPGLHVLEARYTYLGQVDLSEQYLLWMPEGGVSPRFPAWVQFDTPF